MQFSARNVRTEILFVCIVLFDLKKMRFSARNVQPFLFSMCIALFDTFCAKIALLQIHSVLKYCI